MPLRIAAQNMAVNTPVQGSAADLIKKAMIDVRRGLRERGLEAKMILQVHDEQNASAVGDRLYSGDFGSSSITLEPEPATDPLAHRE